MAKVYVDDIAMQGVNEQEYFNGRFYRSVKPFLSILRLTGMYYRQKMNRPFYKCPSFYYCAFVNVIFWYGVMRYIPLIDVFLKLDLGANLVVKFVNFTFQLLGALLHTTMVALSPKLTKLVNIFAKHCQENGISSDPLLKRYVIADIIVYGTCSLMFVFMSSMGNATGMFTGTSLIDIYQYYDECRFAPLLVNEEYQYFAILQTAILQFYMVSSISLIPSLCVLFSLALITKSNKIRKLCERLDSQLVSHRVADNSPRDWDIENGEVREATSNTCAPSTDLTVETVRRDHTNICDLVSEADELVSPLLGFAFLLLLPAICFTFYTFVFSDSGFQIVFFIALLSLFIGATIFVAVPAAILNSRVRCVFKAVYCLHIGVT